MTSDVTYSARVQPGPWSANAFSQRVIEEWNSLPIEVVNASSVDDLKEKLDTSEICNVCCINDESTAYRIDLFVVRIHNEFEDAMKTSVRNKAEKGRYKFAMYLKLNPTLKRSHNDPITKYIIIFRPTHWNRKMVSQTPRRACVSNLWHCRRWKTLCIQLPIGGQFCIKI